LWFSSREPFDYPEEWDRLVLSPGIYFGVNSANPVSTLCRKSTAPTAAEWFLRMLSLEGFFERLPTAFPLSTGRVANLVISTQAIKTRL